MSYLEEFNELIESSNYPKFLSLWEEYSSDESCEPKELLDILEIIKKSEFAKAFGTYVETTLPLWKKIEEEEFSYEILKLILDIQSTNNPDLAEIAFQFLKDRYGDHKYFSEKIRLIGLRHRKEFQGALRNYELLTHMNRGRFVYHTGGWGTGEIVDISLIREELILEFEYVVGKRSLTFSNAFKNLVSLSDEHFLACRFGDPDKLEAEAKEDPVKVVRMLLRDLGPKTGAELKEELYELVIQKEDWSKWWQSARAKIKKDTLIEVPPNVKLPFRLRQEAMSHSQRFSAALQGKKGFGDVLTTIYNFTRDYPEILKDPEQKTTIREHLEALYNGASQEAEKFEVLLFMEHLSVPGFQEQLQQFTAENTNIEDIVDLITIIAFKKRALIVIRQYRDDWKEKFCTLLFSLQLTPLKDYILKELLEAGQESILEEKFEKLIEKPISSPETLIWYFQKIISKDGIPFANKAGQCVFFEGMLVLMHQLESRGDKKDLLKKIYQIITSGRYSVVRAILQDTSKEYVKEFLLLMTKCRTLNNHDIKIMHSLAEVVHPDIAEGSHADVEEEVIWTTAEGYEQIKARIQEIGTIEMVDNAKEIESARALGDLRENSEYKFAQERRARLQGELKTLSDQLSIARIITAEDLVDDEVSVGTEVTLNQIGDGLVAYKILGPWDADIDLNILSYQSKLAQNMLGHKIGDQVELKGKTYSIETITPCI